MTFQEYLDRIREQVGKYGKGAMQFVSEPSSLQMGFRSPEGSFLVGLSQIKAHFQTDTWREHSEVVAFYQKVGGQTPLTAMTRLPPTAELIRLISESLRNALTEGDLLFKAQQDPSRVLS
jgi:hypothetical protein